MPRFSLKEKRKHYTEVANGTKPTKANSKFSEAEQRAYARGQRDALNESARITKYKNSTLEERAAYKAQKRIEREAYKAQKEQEKTAKSTKVKR